jgi:hypothetical protein
MRSDAGYWMLVEAQRKFRFIGDAGRQLINNFVSVHGFNL